MIHTRKFYEASDLHDYPKGDLMPDEQTQEINLSGCGWIIAVVLTALFVTIGILIYYSQH